MCMHRHLANPSAVWVLHTRSAVDCYIAVFPPPVLPIAVAQGLSGPCNSTLLSPYVRCPCSLIFLADYHLVLCFEPGLCSQQTQGLTVSMSPSVNLSSWSHFPLSFPLSILSQNHSRLSYRVKRWRLNSLTVDHWKEIGKQYFLTQKRGDAEEHVVL